MSDALLSAHRLDVAAGPRVLVSALELDVRRGEIVCVLGVNGAGKSTTLETLCGLLPPAAGEVRAAGRALARWPLEERARHIGLMLQSVDDSFAMRAVELVAMGRHPHKSLLAAQDEVDFSHARAALDRVGLARCAQQHTDTLSGGERQRLALAMLLCQAPALMLLDEPVSQLDPYHRQQVAALLRELRDAGHGIVLSAHDVNFAAAVSDRSLLLFGDTATGAGASGERARRWLLGPSAEILTAQSLTELYGTPVRHLKDGERDWFAVG